jgi:GxxExxY protein
LALELSTREIAFQAEVELPIHYKGKKLSAKYRADFVCFDSIIVELKALSALTGVEESQVINYLKTTGFKVGLLINFGQESLQFKRLVL